MPALRARRADRVGGRSPAVGRASRRSRGGPRRRDRELREPGPLRRAFSRLRRLAPRMVRRLSLLVALGAGLVVWQTGAAGHGLTVLGETAIDVSRAAGFVVEDVFVEGRRRAPKEGLRASLGVARGDAMLLIDPGEAKARLEENPWVAAARVERQLPNALYIRIVERRPMALWQHRGAIRLVDRGGRILTDHGVEAYAALPLVVGAGAPEQLPALVASVAATPDLYRRLSAANWVGGRRWTLRFDDRIDVLLPEGPTDRAWARLVALQEEVGILETRLARIDLRSPDRVLVRFDSDTPAGAGT